MLIWHAGALGGRYPPSCRGLAQIIHQRTDGHPLFLVTVVEHLLQRGVLREVAGQWEVQIEAAAVAMEVPAGVRQMIEQQFDQLSPEEQRVLEAASVAGNECAVAAVAAGLDLAMEAVEDCCAGLAQRGRFLVASGLETWPDGTVTERYRWQHTVHQEVVYARMSVGRCLRLHRRIGAREEVGYGARASERAAELAVHFVRGRDQARAVQYLQQAAANALQRYAYREAIAPLTTALEILATLPETPERDRHELAVQLAIGTLLQALKGYAAPDVFQAYSRAHTLCQRLEDPTALYPVVRGLWGVHGIQARFQTAQTLAEQLVELARGQSEALRRVEAQAALGVTLLGRGELHRAQTHLEQALRDDTPQQLPAPTVLHSEHSGVTSLVLLAWVLWLRGFPDRARQWSAAALTQARALAHPFTLAFVLHQAAGLAQFGRELSVMQARVEELLAVAQEFTQRLAVGRILQGWLDAMHGHPEAGIAQMRASLTAYRATGSESRRPYHLLLLAEAYGAAGQAEEGLRALAEARGLVEQTDERFCEAELYRLQGELLLQQAGSRGPQAGGAAEAETCLHQALTIARRQQTKAWELRAAVSLSRLWQQQGKRDAARVLLADVYGWFTEGFDTADLQEAKALLEAMA